MQKSLFVAGVLLALSPLLQAASKVDECMADVLKRAPDDAVVSDIRNQCTGELENKEEPSRLRREAATENNPWVLTPHRQNYILPYSYMRNPNQEPYNVSDYFNEQDPMENQEAKFQISFKVPLTYTKLLTEDDAIYFGFTLKSFWQVYNHPLSAPFRETNYQPELFYRTSLPWRPANGSTLFSGGIEHQSNGRSQLLSRSWNRAYLSLGYVKDNWGILVRPWYRIPEDEKEDDGDPTTPPPAKGDDNPDIEDYMGHQEITFAYNVDHMEFSALTRYNFDTGYGALEVGWSFPLYGRLRGFVQYFNGYGESLIDYDAKIERIGVGFLLTDLL